MKKFLRSVFGQRTRPIRTRADARTRLNVENLDRRDLPSVTAALGGSILTITGDDAANTVAVSTHPSKDGVLMRDSMGLWVFQYPAMVRVESGASSWEFAAANVTRIAFNGLGGDDTFRNASDIGATVDGGAGSDNLYSGGGDDVLIGGTGNDTYWFDTDRQLGRDEIREVANADTDTLRCFGSRGVDIDLGGTYGGYVGTSKAGNWWEATLTSGWLENAYGGAGDDSIKGTGWHNVIDGGAGNDVIQGLDGNDTITGGDGGDLIYAGAGNDVVDGGNGNDTIDGGAGDDTLKGGLGDDWINGQAGADKLIGSDGADVLIAIDGAYGDVVDGGTGRDVIWVDHDGSVGEKVTGLEAGEKVAYVNKFANGADRTLDRDNVPDPAAESGAAWQRFSGPLFSTNGPVLNDIRQGTVGDCWLLAELAAAARDNPQAVRQRVVDFYDGTYGVWLGKSFYRVDGDLPVKAGTDKLLYAQLGTQGSLWVAVVEKAYAHFRTGANTYDSLSGGHQIDAARALGATDAHSVSFKIEGSAQGLANAIGACLSDGASTTLSFSVAGRGTNLKYDLINHHAYTVAGVSRDAAGNVTKIKVRNPWGVDTGRTNQWAWLTGESPALDGNNDGYITLTPAQLFSLSGEFSYGRL